MSRTRPNRFVALLLALLVLAPLTSVATAQIDDRARELLEGMVAAAADLDLVTLDQTMVMTIPQDGGEITTRTRTAIDYENKRAASITELGDGMTTRMVHQDGNTVMHMPGMDMAMPVPPQMAGIFESVFDTPVQNLLDQEGATATYDGRVSYGDLIEGQQVTYTGSFDVMGVTESSETKFLFDDAGAPIGMVTEVDGDVIVMVYETPFDSTSPLPTRDMTMYRFDGSVGTLYATMHYEDVRVNEPLDESLFE